jgi:hypothetical protein
MELHRVPLKNSDFPAARLKRMFMGISGFVAFIEK